jgi:OOP family OmpA-OmpF porin
MKRRGLFLFVAMALSAAGAAHAQDTAVVDNSSAFPGGYDNRWYIAPMAGAYFNDSSRHTNNHQFFYGIGFGRFLSQNISLEGFFDRTKRTIDGSDASWFNNSAGVSARFYARGWTDWRPYAMAGVMGSFHHNPGDNGWSPAAQLGLGLSKMVTDRTNVRFEAGYRYDWDDKSQTRSNSLTPEDGYGDWFVNFTVAVRLGATPAPPPAPVVAPPPAAPDCSKMDSDGDGVNDCDDKCPNTAAGTIVGPDGCPQKVVIDLRGVNFKFDRPKKGETNIAKALAEPSADSIAILDQAVDTLQRYPQVKVTVAGYTDSVGTDAYNQSLSERRAKIVYDYLTSHGVSASRLEGPIGHGEADPIDSNDTDAGRARNRRTELQVQQ